MQFFTVVLAIAGLAAAAPSSPLEDRQTFEACSGIYGSAQCCATDVLGVADLDCGQREYIPGTLWDSP